MEISEMRLDTHAQIFFPKSREGPYAYVTFKNINRFHCSVAKCCGKNLKQGCGQGNILHTNDYCADRIFKELGDLSFSPFFSFFIDIPINMNVSCLF